MKEVGQENSWREATASFSEAAVIDIDCEIPGNRTCEEPIVDVVKTITKQYFSVLLTQPGDQYLIAC